MQRQGVVDRRSDAAVGELLLHGVAPLTELFRSLRDIGYTGMLSLELFSKALYQQDPLEVAKTGLAKT